MMPDSFCRIFHMILQLKPAKASPKLKLREIKTPEEQKYLRYLIAEIEERKNRGEKGLTIKFKNKNSVILL